MARICAHQPTTGNIKEQYGGFSLITTISATIPQRIGAEAGGF